MCLWTFTTWEKTAVWRMKLKRLAWSALLLISSDWKSVWTTRGPSVAPLSLSLSLIVLHAAAEIELIFCKLDLWITQCDSNKCLAENGFQSHSKWKLLQSKRAFLCLSSSSPSWLCVWVYMGWIWIHFLGNWIDTVMHEGSATLLQRADGLSDWIG